MKIARTRVACALALALVNDACRTTAAPRSDREPRDAAPVVRDPGDAAAATAAGEAAAEVRDGGGPPAALACIVEHYVGRAERGGAGWGLRLPDGAFVPYDDGRAKTTAERIASPDIEDMFAIAYPTGGAPPTPVTDEEEDPGRVRVESLFRATYGNDAAVVGAALVGVKFAGHAVRVHRRAAPALSRVASRIDVLVRADPSLGRYVRDLGGTFAVRTIAGTDRTSAHAWGIAIDIDTSQSDYWRNARPPVVWRNRIPRAIVEAFESEGFVWGGRWFHYDTMHFEYRPEQLDPRCRTGR